MDKRLLLALALSVGVIVVWTWLFAPPPVAPPPAAGPEPSAGAEGAPAGAPTVAPAAPPGSLPTLAGLGGAPAAAAQRPDLPRGAALSGATEESVVIDTPLHAIALTSRGARVTSWKLKAYDDDHGEPLDLVAPAGRTLDILPLQILVDDAVATRRLTEGIYRVARRDDTVEGRRVTEVIFSWSDGAGTAATKRLRIDHDGYMADLEVRVESGGAAVDPAIVWGAGFSGHTGREEGQYADTTNGVVLTGGEITRRARAEIKPDEPWRVSGPISWAGLEDKYFGALLLPSTPTEGTARFETLRLVEDGREHFHLSFAGRLPAPAHRLFIGPKDYDLLKQIDQGLDRLVDFGFFSPIALPLFYAMKFIHRYTGNFGWSIVILTVLIRLLFFPFMHKGQLKMRRMQDKMKRVQPKVKAMRERYRRLEKKELEKGNARGRHALRQKMNEEMMAMYKEEQINPLGSMSGCLPLLLQIPILYAFYTILTMSIELRKAPFILWIGDLSQKDPYYVTPIVMGATMLIQQAMTSASIPDPTQRRIMYIMPIMFTYFFINLPSGLVLYWLVNNLLGIVQQYLINREADAENQKDAERRKA